MSTPLHIGPSGVACRRMLKLGVSLLAITAAMAPMARAQTVVGPGQTVTNNGSTKGFYRLTGDNGTLVNLGTISVSSAAAVEAYIQPFTSTDLSTYRITGITLNNSGAIKAVNSNDLAAVSVDGFTLTNSGTMTNGGNGFPSLYLNFVNNLQFNNTGNIFVDTTGTGARVANIYAVTNSNLTNNGTMAINATSDNLPAVFISAGSSNVTFNNNGTISTVGGGQAILVGNDSLNSFTTTIDGTNVVTVQPIATNIVVNNAGVLSSNNLALTIGGKASMVTVNNSGTIITTSPVGTSAITVRDAANNVSIVNTGLIVNHGTGAAISVSTTGAGVVITNTGTITEAGGNGIAIEHLNGSAPLTINNTNGVINGNIPLLPSGDVIFGGVVNGAFIPNGDVNTVTFNSPGTTTTTIGYGTATNPFAAITVAGGTLNLGNSLVANTVTFGAGSTTNLLGSVNAVTKGGTLNFAGGTVNLGTYTLTLGGNTTIRTTANGSIVNLTIGGGQNGMISAPAGIVDTSKSVLLVNPTTQPGVIPKLGAEYAVIQTGSTSITNALTNLKIAPGAASAMFSIGTATTTTDAYGKPLTPGNDIVLTVTGNSSAVTNAAIASSSTQILQAQVNAVTNAIGDRIGDAIANAITGAVSNSPPGPPQRGISGGDEAESEHNFTMWMDTTGSFLSDSSVGSTYSGQIWTGLAGIDTPLTDKIIAGVVVGGEGDSFSLSSFGGHRYGNGVSITPYVAYIISDWASIDAEFSYAQLDNNVTVTAGSPVLTHYTSNRVFGATNLSAFWTFDDLTLRGKVGFLMANTGGPTYTDSTGVRSTPPSITLQELKAGGEVSYRYGQFQPYLNLTMEDNIKGTGNLNTALTGVSSPGRYGLLYDVGLRYKTEGNIQFGFHVGGETLQGNQSEFVAGLFARIPL